MTMGHHGRSRHAAVSIALVVALGVGANVVVMSVLRHSIIGSFPYADVDRLVVLENRGAYNFGIVKVPTPQLSWPDFQDVSDQVHALSEIGGVTAPEPTAWDAGARIRSVQRVFVTRGFFRVLGSKPRIGRLLGDSDFEADAPGAILVTASLWRAQLGSDFSAVGHVVRVDGRPFTLVGVVDDDVMASLRERKTVFERGDDRQCLIVPIVSGSGSRMDRLLELRRQNRNRPTLTAFGRLKAGRSIEDAQREVQAVSDRLAHQYPDTNRERTANVVSLQEWRTREVKHLLPVLFAVGFLAWLAACASAAGLVMADAVRREPEMAMRQALGASRPALVRLVLWRSLRWTMPGGLLGLAFAWAVVLWIAPGPGQDSGSAFDLALVVQAAGLTVLAGLALGGVAAWVSLRHDVTLGLKEAANTGLPSRRRRVALGMVIAFQITAATALSLVSGLLIRSMVNIINVDVGFDTGQTFMVRAFLPEDQDQTGVAQTAFLDTSLSQIRSLPSVASAGISNTPPLSRVVVTSGGDYALDAPGRPSEALGPLFTQYVSPGYFETMGMRLIRGRGFSTEDYRAATPVIVVDEAFCRQHLRSVDPLAAGVRMNGALFRIIGVLHDVRPDGPTENARATLYVVRDKRQPRQVLAHFVVRPSRVDPQLMDRVVGILVALDRRVVVDDPQRLETLLSDTQAHRRRTLRMLSLAAAIVLMLTAFSISGALSEFVAHKTRELALRKALGATSPDTVRQLARHLARPCIAGLAIGSVGGWSLARMLSSDLFGVASADPVTMVATILGVFAVGLIAAIGPLTRAIAIDPAHSLRAL